MPPSGYSSREADSIVAFLRSCSVALKQEAVEKGHTLLEALKNEVNDIEALLSEGTEPPTIESVLRLTADFYRRVAAGNTDSFQQYTATVDNTLKTVNDEILAVHVPPGLSEKLKNRSKLVTAVRREQLWDN